MDIDLKLTITINDQEDFDKIITIARNRAMTIEEIMNTVVKEGLNYLLPR